MFFRIAFIIILTLCILFTISCKREYSYEAGPGAVYSFIGSPGACANALVNGNYMTGITTDSSNSVQLMVQVTKTGNYDITTNTADGISFYQSGDFIDTGIQTITLYAKGIPDTSGSFQIQIPGTGGCDFTILVAPQAPASYQLSGAPADCSKPYINGSYIGGKSLNDQNKMTIRVDVFSPGAYTITTDTVNGLYFAASGYFSNTGNQQITLQGEGISQQPGLYYFTIHGGSTTCEFYLLVQSAEPLAYYVLESGIVEDTVICTPNSVQGIYITNSPIVRSNTVTITIYVAQPGNYTIATTRVNGVKFQYSGTFTEEGQQSVVLFAEGMPQKAGTFLYTAQIVGPATLGGNDCSFHVEVK
jgi:hypothetical protein